MNTDGVVRIYNSTDYTVLHAEAWTAEDVASQAALYDKAVAAVYIGVDGTKVPTEKLMQPDDTIIA